jgi:hypothetical protein
VLIRGIMGLICFLLTSRRERGKRACCVVNRARTHTLQGNGCRGKVWWYNTGEKLILAWQVHGCSIYDSAPGWSLSNVMYPSIYETPQRARFVHPE